MDAYKIIKYPINTEKAVRLMERENKLTLIVDRGATKHTIKNAAEEIFKVKVVDVNSAIRSDGTKVAFVKLSRENPAIDVLTRLGLA